MYDIHHPVSGGKEDEGDYINNIKEHANTILEVSNGIITHNLIETESDKVGKCIKK